MLARVSLIRGWTPGSCSISMLEKNARGNATGGENVIGTTYRLRGFYYRSLEGGARRLKWPQGRENISKRNFLAETEKEGKEEGDRDVTGRNDKVVNRRKYRTGAWDGSGCSGRNPVFGAFSLLYVVVPVAHRTQRGREKGRDRFERIIRHLFARNEDTLQLLRVPRTKRIASSCVSSTD